MFVTWKRSDINKNLLKSLSTLQMYIRVQLRYYDDIHAFMYRILHIQLNDNRMTVMNKYGCAHLRIWK